MPEILIVGAVVLLLGGGIAYYLSGRGRRMERPSAAREATVVTAAPTTALATAEAEPAATETVLAEAKRYFYCTAFSVTRFDYAIRDTHERVIGEVERSLGSIAEHERLLPRRPMLLPQLLRALNDPDSTRRELSAIILQDPVLAGDVLKLANSPYYRIAREPVDSIDRAIVLLGTEGLKAVVAASIMQPVFRLPKGHFDAFATTLWELALRTSAAVGAYAAQARLGDRFSAQLLGLLSALGPLALFRLTSETYRQHSDVLPRAEVFIRLIDTHADATSSTIAAHWHLPEAFVTALAEAGRFPTTGQASPLGQALHVGRGCALLSLAHDGGHLDATAVRAGMLQLGVASENVESLWAALTAREPAAE